jgi:hypothetical protein
LAWALAKREIVLWFVECCGALVQSATSRRKSLAVRRLRRGRLLLLDALEMEWRTVRFKKDAGCAVCR